MEIHGSSVNYAAIRSSDRTVKQTDAVQNQTKKEKQTHTAAQENLARNQSQTPEQVEALLEISGLSSLADPNPDLSNTPTDNRTLNAIKAYHQQASAPLVEQRAKLVSGIDLYV
jgi:LAS superfamily LD-carboxypeptidase LdcB